MRWLLDQGLPRDAARLLNEAGHDALHVGDLGMSATSDTEILAEAKATDRVLVTLDADFHQLLARSGDSRPSVIRIREEGLKAQDLFRCMDGIAQSFPGPLNAGCVMTYHNKQLRYRRLPL
jgi:predicted nuclease of predicted toxin-antitoxin system